MVNLQSLWQPPLPKHHPQGGLTIFRFGMALYAMLTQTARITQQARTGNAVIQMNQRDKAHIGNPFVAASIHFPDGVCETRLLALTRRQRNDWLLGGN